jgi:hypothetical protein
MRCSRDYIGVDPVGTRPAQREGDGCQCKHVRILSSHPTAAAGAVQRRFGRGGRRGLQRPPRLPERRALHPRRFQVAELPIPLRLGRRSPLLTRLQLGLRVLELRLEPGAYTSPLLIST